MKSSSPAPAADTAHDQPARAHVRAVTYPQGKSMTRPNILVIQADQMTALCLSAYGKPYAIT
ncbi:MAG: hypothetical protein AAF822_17835, partial [Pseudomonadota bacterium]